MLNGQIRTLDVWGCMYEAFCPKFFNRELRASEPALLPRQRTRNGKNISSGHMDSRHVMCSSHVVETSTRDPILALDVRPQNAAAPQHKWKNPNKLGPFMQTGTGVRGGAASDSPMPTTICRSQHQKPRSGPGMRATATFASFDRIPILLPRRHVAAVPGCRADWQANGARSPRSRSAAAFACEFRLENPLGTNGMVTTHDLEDACPQAPANQAAGLMCGLVKQSMS
jgi:hypothetical protein